MIRLLRAHLLRLQAEAQRFVLAGEAVPDTLVDEIAGFGWLTEGAEA